jgi:hypothetical protein
LSKRRFCRRRGFVKEKILSKKRFCGARGFVEKTAVVDIVRKKWCRGDARTSNQIYLHLPTWLCCRFEIFCSPVVFLLLPQQQFDQIFMGFLRGWGQSPIIRRRPSISGKCVVPSVEKT